MGLLSSIAVVILAAGFSSRMKRNKLLLPFKGRTVIENTVESFMNSEVDKIVIVLGNEKKEVREIPKVEKPKLKPEREERKPVVERGKSTGWRRIFRRKAF